MKLLFAFSTLITVAFAKPSGFLAAPLAYAAVPIAAPVSSQYHAQDELGQYSYGYASPLSAKAETKTFDGVTRGSYSYVDAGGKLQSVEYVSDAVNGFRAAASNLPLAPAVPAAPALVAPVPVSDTPEVAEAKAQHLAALQEIASRSSSASAEPASSEAPAPATDAPAPTEPAPVVNASSEAAPQANATLPLSPIVPPVATVVASPYSFAVPAVSAFAAPAFTAYGPAVATYSAPWTVVAPAPVATIAATAAPDAKAEEAKQN